jgi:hypothetical protein
VHLVVPVGAVVDPDRLGGTVERQQQDDGVVGDLPSVRRELDPKQCPKNVVEDSLVVGAHERANVTQKPDLLSPPASPGCLED